MPFNKSSKDRVPCCACEVIFLVVGASSVQEEDALIPLMKEPGGESPRDFFNETVTREGKKRGREKE